MIKAVGKRLLTLGLALAMLLSSMVVFPQDAETLKLDSKISGKSKSAAYTYKSRRTMRKISKSVIGIFYTHINDKRRHEN